MILPCISLWQPWAELVVIGAKRFETRHWPCPESIIGTRVAIHAAKKWNRELSELSDYFEEMLAYSMPETFSMGNLAFGSIIGTAELVDCREVVHSGVHPFKPVFTFGDSAWEQEMEFGNYSLDEGRRFAWHLANPIKYAQPIPCIGRQGFFNVEVPE